MSELKVYRFLGQDEVWPDANIGRAYYLKSEADKVIMEQKDKLRHQKYKRCLDKARYWVAVSYQCIDDKHRQRAEKHHYKWLELANKFKEATR